MNLWNGIVQFEGGLQVFGRTFDDVTVRNEKVRQNLLHRLEGLENLERREKSKITLFN